MAYRLYFDKFDEVKKYNELSEDKYNRVVVKKCTPVKFMKNGNLKDSFKIEEIDAVLSGYRNKYDFLLEAKSHNIDYLTREEQLSDDLCIVLKYKGYKEIKPIFYDKLIYLCAVNLMDIKKKNNNGEHQLKNIKELDDLVNTVKEIALNDKMNKLLLNPLDINYLTYSEKTKINDKRFDTKDVNGDKRIIGLRTLLENYRNHEIKREENKIYGISTTELEKEIELDTKEIFNYFSSDYLNIRAFVEWENNCLDVLRNKKNPSNLIEYQINYLEKVKEKRNGIIKENKIIPYFDSEELEYLYSNGDMDEVYSVLDLDDILSSSNDDQKKLGYYKK